MVGTIRSVGHARKGNNLGRVASRTAYRQAQLHATAAFESLRQMFKGQIVNADNDWAGRKRGAVNWTCSTSTRLRRSSALNVSGNTNKGRVRRGAANLKVWPAIAEAFSGFALSDKDRVLVDFVDLGQRLDQVRRITLVTAKAGPN